MKGTPPREEKQTAEDIAYQKIKVAINKRYIQRGRKLVETSLAQQLRMSRTPVRGAIRRLAYEGFVEFIPNKGAFVIEPSLVAIKQTFSVRAQLEKMAANQAATHIRKTQIKKLYRLIEEEAKLFKAREMAHFFTTNDAIHIQIAEASQNPVLVRYVKDLLNLSTIYLILFDPFYRLEINPSQGEHTRIVKALEKGDGKKAEQLMEKHLESVFGDMIIDEDSLIPEDYLSS